MPLAEASPGIVLGTFCERVWEAALAERAPFVSEWHIARVLNEYHSADLQQVFVRPENLLARVGELIGMESSSESDKTKTWFVCDTNVFTRYHFFDQADWNTKLNVETAVLVLPRTTQRELDKLKSDPRERQGNKRARQVLPRLRRLVLGSTPGQPIVLPNGVELLPLSREPIAFPYGLDPLIEDDRVIATALEFRWRHPGRRVVVLSEDLGTRTTARDLLLEQVLIPDDLKLESARTDDEKCTL